MGTSVLHIKTDVECKIFLFDEEKGIASPNKYLNLEVRKGDQDIRYVSIDDERLCGATTYHIEESDCDYSLSLTKEDFELLSPEVIDLIGMAQKGYMSAQSKLGCRYYDGNGVKKDFSKALKWFKKAAEQGDDVSQTYLGVCLIEAIGIEKNIEEGLFWIRKAVEKGNARAENALGFCFWVGWGMDKDDYQAFKWFKLAAEHGNSAGQHHLAMCYHNGTGVDKNPQEAFKWYNKAASSGGIRSLVSLASCYEDGFGVDVNLDEALRLYGVAAKYGDIYAIDGVKRLKNKIESLRLLSTNDKTILLDKPSLEEIVCGFEDEYGVVYSKDGTQLLKCKNEEIEKYRIKKGCKVIRNCAFYRCYHLSEVILPQGLTHIGDSVFGWCCFETITLPDSLQHIGEWAFTNCEQLNAIKIPISLIHLGDNVFRATGLKKIICNSPNFKYQNGCLIDIKAKKLIAFLSDDSDVDIPDIVTHIGSGAFSGSNINSVTLPANLTYVGDEAFSWCGSLSYISNPAKLKYIGNSAFYNCERLSAMVFPEGLTYIGDEAFHSCKELSSIILPNSITYVGKGAFSWCEKLKNVVFSNNLSSILEKTFEGCTKLSNIMIPDNIKKIENDVFNGCHNLKHVSLPKGLIYIGDRTFQFCEQLSDIILPCSLLYIGDEAFHICKSLNKINLPHNLEHIGAAAFIGTNIKSVVSDSTNFVFNDGCLIDLKEKTLLAFLSDEEDVKLPDGITHIGYGAFIECKIRQIILPLTLTHVAAEAFGWCRSLSSIAFPSGVIQVGNNAFTVCETLSSVEFREGLSYLGDEVFSLCKKLNRISLPRSLSHVGNKLFGYSENNIPIIQIPEGSRKHFEELLPSELHNKLEEGYQQNEKKEIVKPYYLFFDTETTGVPYDYNAPASNTRNWPRLVQLGWLLTDKFGNVLSSGNEIVKPNGFVIPKDASNVHGITTEIALKDGKPLNAVIESFLKDLKGVKYFVGHNVSFDQKVVGAELYRLGLTDTISTAQSLDTMKAATDYCSIPGPYGYKWPKLIELYRKLFDCDFEDAHDAMADITATKKCFFEMKRRNLI